MKRRWTALPLLLCVLLQLTACGPSAGAETPAPSPAGETAPVSTLEPTPEHTPELTPEPTPAPDFDTYFDHALFVGDSIMEGIRQYVAKRRSVEPTLGEAEFVTSVDGVTVASLADGGGYRYKGEDRPLARIVAELAPERIFLLLGLNDLEENTAPVVEDIAGDYLRLIELVREAAPGAEVIVMTNPPKIASQWLPDYTANRGFGNELIGAFVAALKRMCEDNGIPYVDTHAALQGENGALPDEWCRDGFLHLNDAGSAVAVEALNEFARERCGL